MTDTKCNGWTNAATWTVNLWFGDDWAAMNEEGESLSADYLREYVQDYVDQMLGERPNGFISDMLDLGGVNWYELARHYDGAA